MKKTLLFNYTAATIATNYRKKKKRTQPDWSNPRLKHEYGYDREFSSGDECGIVVDL